MKDLKALLEDYSSNKKHYTEDKYFKFLKKVYQTAKSTGALNIGFIYYTLNNNSPKSMDLEFMKMYIDSLTPDNSTLVVMFTEYWNENMGMDLLDGLPMQFNLSIKEEEAFAALVANNDLEKVLKLLDITADRIASITSKCEEDMFYSKCLNDYERDEFKNAVAGLQFFGFGKVDEEKMKKAYESLLSKYIEDKNGLTMDLDKLKKAVEQYMKKGKINFSESLMINFSENMKDVKFTMVDSKTNKEITTETKRIDFLEVNLNGGIAEVVYDQERIDDIYDGDEEYYKEEEKSRNIKDIGSDLDRMLDEYFSINSPVILAKNFVSPFNVIYDEENGTEKIYVQLSTVNMLKNNKEYLKLSKEVYKTF